MEIPNTPDHRIKPSVDPADAHWTSSAGPVPLSPNQVQVWRASAHVDGSILQQYLSVLSAEEIDRMQRMRAGLARDEFVVGRGLLRILLAGVLEQKAGLLVFSKGRHGKPGIAGATFNVSHSEGLILIALSREAQLGVDVQWVDMTIEALDIARHSFSPREYKRIAAADEGPARTRLFYECWTRKEAIAKAHGAGLLLPIASFTVPTGPAAGEPVELKFFTSDTNERFEGGTFFLHDLHAGKNFLASLALNREDLSMQRFQGLSPG